MNTRKILAVLGIGLFSGLLASEAAFADGRVYDRRGDRRELHHDRAELLRDFRHGAPASEIARERAEIRHDRRDLRHDRRYHRFGWWREEAISVYGEGGGGAHAARVFFFG